MPNCGSSVWSISHDSTAGRQTFSSKNLTWLFFIRCCQSLLSLQRSLSDVASTHRCLWGLIKPSYSILLQLKCGAWGGRCNTMTLLFFTHSDVESIAYLGSLYCCVTLSRCSFRCQIASNLIPGYSVSVSLNTYIIIDDVIVLSHHMHHVEKWGIKWQDVLHHHIWLFFLAKNGNKKLPVRWWVTKYIKPFRNLQVPLDNQLFLYFIRSHILRERERKRGRARELDGWKQERGILSVTVTMTLTDSALTIVPLRSPQKQQKSGERQSDSGLSSLVSLFPSHFLSFCENTLTMNLTLI